MTKTEQLARAISIGEVMRWLQEFEIHTYMKLKGDTSSFKASLAAYAMDAVAQSAPNGIIALERLAAITGENALCRKLQPALTAIQEQGLIAAGRLREMQKLYEKVYTAMEKSGKSLTKEQFASMVDRIRKLWLG